MRSFLSLIEGMHLLLYTEYYGVSVLLRVLNTEY